MAASAAVRFRRMRRVGQHLTILWLFCVLAGLGTCGNSSFVQGRSWGLPRTTPVLSKARERSGQGRPPRPRGRDAEARQLTNDMKKAESAEEMMALVVRVVDGPIFNRFHASSAYTRLARWKGSGKLLKGFDGLRLCKLNSRVQELIEDGQLGCREFANVMWSISYLFDELPGVLDLVPAIAAQIPLKAKHMDPQGLSNVLWASAKLKDDAPAVLDLVPAIAAQVPVKAKDMKPQELSNVLWASATLKDDAPAVLDLVPAIAAQVPVKAKDMIPQHLSNVLWASATLKDDAPAVLDLVPAIAAQVPVKAKDMKPQELSNILWASATLKNDVPTVLELVPAIVSQIPAKSKDMKPQDFANTLVSLIDLQDQVPEVKSFLADEGGSEVPFVGLVASRVANLVPKLGGSDLLLAVPAVIWACWKLGVCHEELLLAVAKRLGSKKNISSLGAWGLCALSGSYELLDSTDRYHVFKEILQAELTKREFSPSDVGWSLEGPLEWARACK